jgi:hypothetical protein
MRRIPARTLSRKAQGFPSYPIKCKLGSPYLVSVFGCSLISKNLKTKSTIPGVFFFGGLDSHFSVLPGATLQLFSPSNGQHH